MCSGMERASCRLMWIRAKLVQESWVFILANEPGNEKSEDEIEGLWRYEHNRS